LTPPNSTTASVPELLTFAPALDSETTRLILRYFRAPYHEADHLFGWASLLTLLHGGYGRLPLLHGGGLHISGSRAVAEHFDQSVEPRRRLVPREQPLRSIVDDAWKRYNVDVAGDVVAICYFHLLPEREVMSALFAESVPPGEAKLLPTIYPALRWLFTTLLRLDPGRMGDVVLRLRIAFDETDRLIADGRRFITGERPTLADIGLAGAVAPLLLPKGCTAPVPRFDQMPPALQAVSIELRAHPTANFVEGLFAFFADS
jgi:glutathione S-transferase